MTPGLPANTSLIFSDWAIALRRARMLSVIFLTRYKIHGVRLGDGKYVWMVTRGEPCAEV